MAKKTSGNVFDVMRPSISPKKSIHGFRIAPPRLDLTERGILLLLAAMFLIFSAVAFRELYLDRAYWLFPPN